MNEPVLAIGIDAAELELIDRLVEAGKLPNIARLRATGARAVVEHRHGGLQSSAWRTFISGQLVTGHGCYFPKAWRAERMRIEFIDDDWPPLRPFWQDAQQRRPRVALIDVPYLPPPSPGFDGVFFSGWQCHDFMPRRSWPPSLLGEVQARFGAPELSLEQYGPQTPESLERLHREGVAAPGQIADICAWLMERQRFDLFVVVLGSAHRAGHYLWDLSQIDADALEGERRAKLDGALDDVYRACDAAVGRIVAAAPAGARIMLFAMQGMGPNVGWYEHMEQLLELAAAADDSPEPPGGVWPGGALKLAKRVLALPIVKAVTARVPGRLQHLLTPLWTRRMHDWSRTPFFAVPSDLNGYVRVNLAGREPEGIVPRHEVRALLERLAEGFLALKDIASDRPICRRVELIDDIAGPDAPMRQLLPDLVAQWTEASLLGSAGVRNMHGGERRWPAVRRYPSGRAGNHRPNGWVVACGPGVPEGTLLGSVQAVDLAPTLCRWLEMDPPARADGNVVPPLASSHVAV